MIWYLHYTLLPLSRPKELLLSYLELVEISLPSVTPNAFTNTVSNLSWVYSYVQTNFREASK